jgi:hypothetical protein
VGDATGELAEALQPLGLAQPPFQLFLLRDVLDHSAAGIATVERQRVGGDGDFDDRSVALDLA